MVKSRGVGCVRGWILLWPARSSFTTNIFAASCFNYLFCVLDICLVVNICIVSVFTWMLRLWMILFLPWVSWLEFQLTSLFIRINTFSMHQLPLQYGGLYFPFEKCILVTSCRMVPEHSLYLDEYWILSCLYYQLSV